MVNQLIISNDLGLTSQEEYLKLRKDIEVLTFIISKLIKSTGYSLLNEPEIEYWNENLNGSRDIIE